MWQLRRSGIFVILILILTGCGGRSAASTASISRTPTLVEPTTQVAVELARAAAPSVTAQTTSKVNSVSWHSITFNVPPHHIWNEGPYGEGQLYSAPVIAQGRITYDRANAPHVNELPDGIGLTIVHFAGTPGQWLAREQQTRTGAAAIDPLTIRQTMIAGQRIPAYSFMVTGIARSETYPLKLSDNQLLLIETTNADNAAYQAVVDSIALEN